MLYFGRRLSTGRRREEKADPGVIGVVVVGALEPVGDDVVVLRLQVLQRVVRHGGVGVAPGDLLVGVGEVGVGRQEHGDRRGGGATLGSHEEGDEVLGLACLEMDRVDAAGEIGGDLPGEIGFPARVLQVVVVEEDRAVLVRRQAKAGRLPGEGRGR